MDKGIQTPKARVILKAGHKEVRDILQITSSIFETLQVVKSLRWERSDVLSEAEKSWIDATVVPTVETAVRNVSKLVEPMRVELETKGSVNVLTKSKLAFKNSSKFKAHMNGLVIASQTLNAAMTMLCTRKPAESSSHTPPLTRNNTGESTVSLPTPTGQSFEVDEEFLHRRRRPSVASAGSAEESRNAVDLDAAKDRTTSPPADYQKPLDPNAILQWSKSVLDTNAATSSEEDSYDVASTTMSSAASRSPSRASTLAPSTFKSPMLNSLDLPTISELPASYEYSDLPEVVPYEHKLRLKNLQGEPSSPIMLPEASNSRSDKTETTAMASKSAPFLPLRATETAPVSSLNLLHDELETSTIDRSLSPCPSYKTFDRQSRASFQSVADGFGFYTPPSEQPPARGSDPDLSAPAPRSPPPSASVGGSRSQMRMSPSNQSSPRASPPSRADRSRNDGGSRHDSLENIIERLRSSSLMSDSTTNTSDTTSSSNAASGSDESTIRAAGRISDGDAREDEEPSRRGKSRGRQWLEHSFGL